MHESPRIRRLRNDLAALEQLRSESSVFHFEAGGNPPHHYQITFKGKGLWRDRGKVKVLHSHRVEIKLGVSYPRTIPEIRWLTPIYHPNISEIGLVCLGGYGTHWVPSVQLDELCTMLWDMARFHNYDIRSPYNRDAALWVANQTSFLFPMDARSIRDLRVAQGRIEESGSSDGASKAGTSSASTAGKAGKWGRPSSKGNGSAAADDSPSPAQRFRQFMERYGRIFGDSNTAPPEQPAAVDSGPARLLDRPPAAATPDPVGVPLPFSPPPPTAEADETVSVPESAATSIPAPDRPAGPPETPNLAEEEEAVIILGDTIELSPEPRPTLPRGEEILFID